MPTVFNSDLIDDLAREKVVLFLGAGVSSSAVTARGGRIVGWSAFLRSMCAHIAEPVRNQVESLIEKQDFLLACEILQTSLSDRWEDYLTAEFGQRADPSDLHNSIVELRQRIILTTNFDKLIEMSWEALDRSATHFSKVISRLDDKVFRILKDHGSRYIVKIHGTIDSAETLIFSRSEYIRMAFGNEHYASFLENLLLNYTFLFIGFSMNDPAIISLMEMYALRYKTARPHYIFTSNTIEANIADIYKKLRKLQFIQYDGADFHVALPGIIRELGEQARERKKQIIASAIS